MTDGDGTTRPTDGDTAATGEGLPEGLELQRVTDVFDADSVPAGLLRAHQIAEGVWGRVLVVGGTLRFVWEDDPDHPVQLTDGDSLVVPPQRRHHVELGDGARFAVEFHR